MENGMNNGQPQYGGPQYGEPQYGAPQYGAPQYGEPQYGAPQYGAPQYGEPQYGAPQYGAPQYGEPQYAQQPQYAEPQYGAPQYGAPETKAESAEQPMTQPAPEYAPAPEAQAPKAKKEKKPMGKKQKNIISLSVIGGVLVIAAIVALIVLSSPKVVMKSAIGGAARDLLKRDEIAPVIGMIDQGSIEVSGEVEEDGDVMSAGGKIYFGKNDIFLDNLFAMAEMEGETYLDLSASIYLAEDYFYIDSEELLDNAIGLTKGDAESAFLNSIFAGKGEYGVGEEAEVIISTILRVYDEDKLTELTKDLDSITKKYEKKVTKLLNKYAEFESESDKVKVGGERINARIVTLTIDGNAMAKMAGELVDEIVNDKELENFVIEWYEYVEDALSEADLIDTSFDIEDAYDEIIEELEDLDIEDMIEDSVGDDVAIVVEVVTPKMSSKLLKLTVTAQADREKMELCSIDFGEKGVKKSDEITVSVEGEVVCKYEIKENSNSAYKAEFKYTDTYYDYDEYKYKTELVTAFSIDIDRSSDSFKIKVPSEDSEVVIKGSINTKGGTTEIGINSVTVDGEKFEGDIAIDVVIKDKDKISGNLGKGDYDTIDDITNADIEAIIEKISELDF